MTDIGFINIYSFLPEVSVKPYVKYGVGVRKKWKDNISGFGQVYVSNGGRCGVGLQAGVNWLFNTRNVFVRDKKNKEQEKL